MAYEKRTLIDNVTVVNKDLLNHIQDGIYANSVAIEKADPYKYLYQGLVKKVLCIGDSMTAGWRQSQGDIKALSYPACMEKMSGWECTNAATGGQTPSGWYSGNFSKYTYTDYDTCIIYLGQNQGLTDTLDADVKAHDIDGIAGTGSDNYATTQTGYYCKIIADIMKANSKIQFFLVAGTASGSSSSGQWARVQQIGKYFNIPVINLNPNPYLNLNLPEYHPYIIMSESLYRDPIHYGTLGYWALGKVIYESILDYISQNLNKYQTFNAGACLYCTNNSSINYKIYVNGTEHIVEAGGKYTKDGVPAYSIIKVETSTPASGNAVIKYNSEQKASGTTAVTYSFRQKCCIQITSTINNNVDISELL